MIKHYSKQELIELVYQQNVELQDLQSCTTIQHELITDMSTTYEQLKNTKWYYKLFELIKLPFILRNRMNKHETYFYTYKLNKFKTMNEQHILQALEYINRHETRSVSVNEYMSFIESLINVKLCKTCGASNNRLHNDFQRRIFQLMKADFNHLALKIQFMSGKYKSAHYTNTVPFYTYRDLANLLVQMKKEITIYQKRGITTDELAQDIVTLKQFIETRKNSYINKETVEQPLVKEAVDSVVNDIKTEPQTLKEPTVEEDIMIRAKALFDQGIHVRKIATELGIEYKGLTAKLKEM